ncbi:tectonic [Drosophila sulfurigaster albostrigata]|uniref:tectonic n=1 Tax=Drosophila sulfurigaster albostrigata TaxID=89887 RepID=UPI002D21E7A8|nr:tectonic [Drosophila sulfurigaster albostrigata]
MVSLLFLCLILAPVSCIKIGISQDLDANTTTTTTTPATPLTTSTTSSSPTTPSTTSSSTTSTSTPSTEAPLTTINLDAIATSSPAWSEVVSTPAQTFPPRKTAKTPTTTTPRRTSSTSTTTAAPEVINATTVQTTIVPPRQDYRLYYCECDLQSELCEINCCCDRDCPAETLQVFNCLQSSVAPQLQTRLEDFQYTHGLPTCQLHDGWLCVFRSNTKPAKPKPLSNNFDAEQYNKWPEQLTGYEEQLVQSSQSTSHYKYGQALQLWQPEIKELSDFELPLAYESANCQLKQALRHLEPMQSSCLLKDALEMQSHLWTLLNLTSSHQLLAKPFDPEDQEVQGIDIEICQQLLQQPQMQCNETQLDINVDSIELKLLHNYTHILSAKLILKEASALEEHDPLWLHYELNFKTATAASDLTKPNSGPLGYLQGAPLLLSTWQPQNSSDQTPVNLTHHWLTLCEQSRSTVGFGVDLAKHCQLREVAPIVLHNHTEYCQQLQAHIWRQLLPQNCTRLEQLNQVLVSQLGKPQADQWLPLQLSHIDGQLPILGLYNEEQQSLSCRNIILSVSYEFHVAELTLFDGRVPHQNVLRHARLMMGQRHDLEFDSGDQFIELPLSVSVMFFKQQPNAASSLFLSSGLACVISTSIRLLVQ